MRELDADDLLASAEVGDNVLAILGRLRKHREAVRTIVGRISGLPSSERVTAVQQLLILAGLRGLEQMVREEVERMPLEIDLMENKVLGPAIRKGLQQGLQEGLQQGLHEGRQQGLQQGRAEGRAEGELRVIRRQIEKRFGPISEAVNGRLAGLSLAEIEAVAERILDAPTIESLLS